MRSYKIDEMDAASRNLYDILDVICELQFGSDPGKPADRRIDSLLWLARDVSEGIVHALDEANEPDMRRVQA